MDNHQPTFTCEYCGRHQSSGSTCDGCGAPRDQRPTSPPPPRPAYPPIQVLRF